MNGIIIKINKIKNLHFVPMSSIQVIAHASSSKQEECPICFSSIEETSSMHKLKECQHSFCKDCFQEYLRSEISSLNVLKIKCPEQNCPCTLNSSNLEELLDSSDFERYQRLLLQKIAKRTQDIICPRSGCSKLLGPTNNSPLTKCNCGAVVCNLCGGLEHQGKTCIAAVDPEFEVYAAANNLKMCLMCKTMITRVEGCTHITCPICDYDWCWLCGREYAQLHESKCPRVWTPLPPRQIAKEDLKLGACQKLGQLLFKILTFIFYVLMLQIFFPYVLFNIHVEVRIPTRTTTNKLLFFILLTIVELVYLGSFGVLGYLIASHPESSLAFIICMLIIATAPWFAKLIFLIIQRDRKNKRWMSRNSNAFHYTPANRPAKDLESPAQNTQAQPSQETKIKDQNGIEIQDLRIHSLQTGLFERQIPTETEVAPLNE